MEALLSIDATLNLTWALVSLMVLLCWRAEWTHTPKHALLAIACILVLLFPVISTADDVAAQAAMYDLAASPLSLTSGKEIKQVIVPAVLAALHGAGLHLWPQDAAGASLEPAFGGASLSLLLSSFSEIHSPPLS